MLQSAQDIQNLLSQEHHKNYPLVLGDLKYIKSCSNS